MNHLEIYADGAAFRNQGSGFAVILISLNHKWERSFSIGEYSANQSVLQSIKFGMLSIAEYYKEFPIKLYLRSKYARDMLAKDDDGYYKMNPKANKELITEIRSLMEGRDVEVVDGKGNDNSNHCKNLVESAVKDSPVDERK